MTGEAGGGGGGGGGGALSKNVITIPSCFFGVLIKNGYFILFIFFYVPCQMFHF